MSEEIMRHAIQLGEAEFRELADNAPVMIWRSRLDKLCDWFNKPWVEFAGKTQEQLFGFGWADDVHPDDYERCVKIYTEAFDARESFTMPYRLKRHDGAYRWLLDNGAPYYRQGEFAGYFGSCTDITEHKDLESHQEVLLAELNHRVKNNLQLIIAFLQMSKIQAQGDEAKGLLTSAISRIQGVGAVQAELHRSTKGTVDLAEYLPNLAKASLKAESSDNAELISDVVPVNVPFKLASELGLIVNELIGNAIKHGNSESGRISLTIKQLPDDFIQIVVRDFGGGFRAEYLDDLAMSGQKLKGLGLIAALAKGCGAAVTRENECGAVVSVTLHRPK